MLRTQRGQGLHRLLPLVLRLVRVDDRRVEDLAGAVDDRALHAVAIPRVQGEGGPLARRGGQQHVAQVRLEDLEGTLFRFLLQTHAGIQVRGNLQLRAPAPLHCLGQPLAVFHRQVEALGDHALVHRLVARIQIQCEHALVLAAQQRQDAVRRQGFERLVEVEVVLKLSAFGFFAFHDARAHRACGVEALAYLADQVRVGGKPVHQDCAGPVEGRFRVLEALAEELFGQDCGVGGGVVDKQLLELLESCLARDVRLRLPALLVREVKVLHAGLRVGVEDGALELVGELALLLDRLDDRLLALLKLHEVRVTLLDVAQLRVVEAARCLLAVAGNERDRVALGEQLQRRLDLGWLYVEFCRDGRCERCHSCESSDRVVPTHWVPRGSAATTALVASALLSVVRPVISSWHSGSAGARPCSCS